MAHGNHALDDITRYAALNAIDTARRMMRHRLACVLAVETAMEALDLAEEAIKGIAPVVKTSRLVRIRAFITGLFTIDGAAYATSVQSRGGI